MRYAFFFVGLCFTVMVTSLHAQDSTTAKKTRRPTSPRTVARLFWQDSSSNSLRWGDLTHADQLKLSSDSIAGFPKLEKDVCTLVQMENMDGTLIVGVHDHQEGKQLSGWLAINSGVSKEEHGNHFHWRFSTPPKVTLSQLDDQQGNPAHVYEYDGHIYIANDRKNGFTVVSRGSTAGTLSTVFHSGGQGHITLAAVRNQVCYATWIDREGDNAGRVDVVGIGSSASKKYSFQLPVGGIHGATTNSGRVFFAPSDGICWTEADVTVQGNSESIRIEHLSLGKDPKSDMPLRTGAFANHANWVLFVSGKGEDAAIYMIDAKSAKPTVQRLAVSCRAGASLTTPATITAKNGKRYAMLFEESRNSDQGDRLLVVDLDANGDRDFTDARLVKSIEIGRNKIEGHSGHHQISFSESGRLAALTNPAEGSIWILSLDHLEIEAKLSQGGEPTRLIIVGG